MSFLKKTKFEEINNILKYLPYTITASIGNKFELVKIFSIIKNYYDKNNIQPYKHNKNKNIHRLKKNTTIDNVVINEIALNTLFMYSIVGKEFHKVTTYNKAIKLDIIGLNLFKIYTSDKKILNNKNIFDISCIDKHYKDNKELDRQILDDMTNILNTYRNENIFKIIIEDIVKNFNKNKYFQNIKIEHNCECRSQVDNLTRNHVVKPHLAYHDSIISIYNNSFPDKKIEIILEYNEISHKINSQDDLIRSKTGKINAWRYFVCDERINHYDAKKYIKNKFIEDYYKLKIDSEKKEFIINFCNKNNILQSNEKISKLLDELNYNNNDLNKDYVIENIFEDINISNEDLCEYKLNYYDNYFQNLIDNLYLGCCILEENNVSIVKYIIASSKSFSLLTDDNKRDYLDMAQKIIELYEKQLLNKKKIIDLEEVADLIGVDVDLLIKNYIDRNIPYKLDFIKNDENEYFCTNSLQNILNNINKNLYLDINKSKIIDNSLEASSNQILVYKNSIETKRLNKINDMFNDIIDYYCISANMIKELMNKEINKISLLSDYMDYLTQFNPNVKINIYNYT